MEATPATADYEQIRAGLPTGSPDAHDLDSPQIELAFARLAIDHPETVTPGPTTTARAPRILRARSRSRRSIGSLLAQLVTEPVTEVRITPARVGRKTLMCVMLIGAGRREIPLPKGGAEQLSRSLKTALPKANWRVAQNYNTDTGALVPHVFAIPTCLQDGDR
ncbi:hypothetical protein [Streptomyces omiyaensis]|uniref:hypothetical protein n=1 Tax=Streptomyces omiyaensis TaxID=68247 RepID=UPI003701ACB0